MKNLMICLVILVIIFGGIGGYFFINNQQEEKRIEDIKEDWYVEITKEYINVRSEAKTNAEELGRVEQGEVYKVLDINYDSNTYYWYKIDFQGNEGWIASQKTKPWVNDVNNPTDIATPIIKFYEDVYRVVDINDINYRHLEIIEDKDDYEITHKVYHEVVPSEQKDQYWILYTITDGVGKSSSKLQKIEFEERPLETEVIDFSEYR